MKFQLQSVYLIYTRLMVHATLSLAYPKGHVYYMPLIYGIMLLFQSLLCPSVTCDM